MEIVVDRKWPRETYTIGVCSIDGVRFSETLEDKDRGLNDSMPESAIRLKKVYGQTAIPKGRYEIILTYSPAFAMRAWGKKYKGLVPQLVGVKGFVGVRIHPFNTAEESLGCIAVGRNLEKGKVLQATPYYYKLMDDYILPAAKRNEKIWLVVK